MSATFVDTSALLALLDEDDRFHGPAVDAFGVLLASDDALITHSHVVAECCALTQARLGLGMLERLMGPLLGPIRIRWVDAELHRIGVASAITAGRRDLSVVDHLSFAVMREMQVPSAFAFDQDFGAAGFELVPDPGQ